MIMLGKTIRGAAHRRLRLGIIMAGTLVVAACFAIAYALVVGRSDGKMVGRRGGKDNVSAKRPRGEESNRRNGPAGLGGCACAGR